MVRVGTMIAGTCAYWHDTSICQYPIATTLRSQLNWSQYRMLIQIPDPGKREYYELDCSRGIKMRIPYPFKYHTIQTFRTYTIP